MYHFDPFGSTGIDNLVGDKIDYKHNYITFFDQEPIDLVRHSDTFDHILQLESNHVGPEIPGLVVSELNSDKVNSVLEKYGWQQHYYFFHGWAALDWFRGYDRCQLLEPIKQRRISNTFMCPNRIIGGDRWHRVIMMYHMLKQGLSHNCISMPERCPVENIMLPDVAEQFKNIYPDIIDVFKKNNCIPRHMPGESNHPMTSYHLDLWPVVSTTMIYLITETVADGKRLHLTEKTFKPIALGMPFMLQSTLGSLEYLRSYGFRTFGDYWDESYDQEPEIFLRSEKIAKELQRIDRMTAAQKQAMWENMRPVIEHNYNHFYRGGFESILDAELTKMLCDL